MTLKTELNLQGWKTLMKCKNPKNVVTFSQIKLMSVFLSGYSADVDFLSRSSSDWLIYFWVV